MREGKLWKAARQPRGRLGPQPRSHATERLSSRGGTTTSAARMAVRQGRATVPLRRGVDRSRHAVGGVRAERRAAASAEHALNTAPASPLVVRAGAATACFHGRRQRSAKAPSSARSGLPARVRSLSSEPTRASVRRTRLHIVGFDFGASGYEQRRIKRGRRPRQPASSQGG
jgi:hypothetical protein